MRVINLRQEFSRAYGNALNARRRGVPSPDLLRLAIATVRTECRRLMLPRCDIKERLRLIQHDRPGLPELMMALHKTLSLYPDLVKAMTVSDQIMHELHKKDVALHTSIERAIAIVKGAEHAEQLTGSELKALTGQVLASAGQLAADESAPSADRKNARALLDAVAHFDGREASAGKRRQGRLDQRLDVIKEAIADANASARLSESRVTPEGEQRLLTLLPPKDEAEVLAKAAPASVDPAAEIFPDIKGEPLATCLDASVDTFNAAKDELARVAEMVSDDTPVTAPEDYLYYIALAAIVVVPLRDSAELQKRSQVDPDALSMLVQQADDCALLSATTRLFASMANDGHLCLAALTWMVLESAFIYLNETANNLQVLPEQREVARVEMLRLEQVVARMNDRQEDRKARADSKVAEAQADLEKAEKQALLAHVKERLSQGLPVDDAALAAVAPLVEKEQAKGRPTSARRRSNGRS